MAMIYIILIIIAIFVYLIYRSQKPKTISKEAQIEKTKNIINYKEEYFLDHLKTSHLKGYLDTWATLFEFGEKNYLRLIERYKYDDPKRDQIDNDWANYIDTLNDSASNQEMLDCCSGDEDKDLYEESDKIKIKRQEIEKRFEDLLGEWYLDPWKKIMGKAYDEWKNN